MDKKHLKKLRLAHQVSQKELADATGLKVTRIAYLEKNFNKATIADLKLIARALNVSIQDLL